ncbi:hypothetical protein GS41_02575 [Candidatus Pseudothioglobus singularis]|uniref:Uncharacterized protein n=1 Tax=Candidatus Pseudothioglobus singularis PS1 TaxID=1125411 RepID=A0A0M4M483_9GAMM|nr:hypothetical protein W908_02565 [Candidatus Pseudothioglobus singularis PS1]ANQ66249.1 hypothetical protein GS41_02575 [Candidatus Pseudothioglobus singularis]
MTSGLYVEFMIFMSSGSTVANGKHINIGKILASRSFLQLESENAKVARIVWFIGILFMINLN